MYKRGAPYASESPSPAPQDRQLARCLAEAASSRSSAGGWLSSPYTLYAAVRGNVTCSYNSAWGPGLYMLPEDGNISQARLARPVVRLVGGRSSPLAATSRLHSFPQVG